MLWKGRKGSDNFLDLESSTGRRRGGSRLGIGSVLTIGLVVYLLGGDPRIVLNMLEGSLDPNISMQVNEDLRPEQQQKNSEYKEFLSVVLADMEETWTTELGYIGKTYQKPQLVVYRNSVETECGIGQSFTGPFYCPADSRIYLDLSFFDELKKMGGAGDFAMAYVLAHEVGHHVQKVVGFEEYFRKAQAESSAVDLDSLQVKYELQADCYAGIWASYANKQKNFIEEGDIDEGMSAAAAVGDDNIQKMSGRSVSPDSFTHGSSKDREDWFTTGFRNGSLETCDTFLRN